MRLWVPKQTLLLRCVKLDQLLNLTVPQFTPQQNEENNKNSYLIGINIMHKQHLEQWLAYNKNKKCYFKKRIINELIGGTAGELLVCYPEAACVQAITPTSVARSQFTSTAVSLRQRAPVWSRTLSPVSPGPLQLVTFSSCVIKTKGAFIRNASESLESRA